MRHSLKDRLKSSVSASGAQVFLRSDFDRFGDYRQVSRALTELEKEAVLGANVVLTMSTKIIDVTGKEPKEYKGVVPARSVVILGAYTKEFPSGKYQVPCALIIGERKESTNLKTSLNNALREYDVAV